MEEYEGASVDFRKMDGVKSGLHKALRQWVVTIGAEVAALTIDTITINNQVDTGAMRASVFLEIDGSGTMVIPDRETALAIAEEKASHPGVKSGKPQDEFFPETEILWNPEGAFQAKVALGAEYAKWQEKRIKFLAPSYDHWKARSNQVLVDILKATVLAT